MLQRSFARAAQTKLWTKGDGIIRRWIITSEHVDLVKRDTLSTRSHWSAAARRNAPPRPSGARSLSTTPEQILLPSDSQKNTIYALATPPGRGGVAVVRVSGPDTRAVCARLVRPYARGSPALEEQKERPRAGNASWETLEKIMQHRKLVRCAIVHPVTGEELDDGLVVFFKAPYSFTTEDVLELHIHSGRAVVSSILDALGSLSSSSPTPPSGFPSSTAPVESGPLLIRPAQPGEFTRRAFLSGRLDLTQAEALRDLVDAETESQRRVALRASKGASRDRFAQIRDEIIQAMAMVEACIDFGEGEDLEEGVYDQARQQVKGLLATIARHLKESRRGEIQRSGLRLAIFGPPNAGKSSLLNCLAGREAAIVTPIPGTTRDVVELTLDIGGLPVVVADTAGLRKTADVVEQAGIQRATERVKDADVSLCVLSVAEVVQGEKVVIPERVGSLLTDTTYVLLNKTDLSSSADTELAIAELRKRFPVWPVSLALGEGFERFLTGFGRMLHDKYALGVGEEEPLVTNARHRAQLEAAEGFLTAFLATEDVVVGAEELRYAANAIGQVTGAIDVERVLDVIFSKFCIGK